MSVIKQEEDIDKDHDSDIVEDDDENCQKFGNGGVAGRTVTLQMLLAAKMLTPGKSTMTIEYLGQKFIGDLLPDGKIKSQETETIFCSPSAWAMYCKRIINPDKKSGCGWASVKYKGKKLDAIKATWMRKCQVQKDTTASDEDCETESVIEKKEMTPPPPIKRTLLPHNTINNRNVPHDANTLVEAIPFSSLGKMQPFLLTIVKSAMFLMDFHCHLSKTEVCGYLGGTWDVNSHNLLVTHVFPCRNTRYDREKAGDIEMDIQRAMMKKNLILIGWYHSHPKSPAQPTLRDCDTQLDYQIKMKGSTDASYSPCVGFICSPYNEDSASLESTIIAYWIIPPTENKPMEYGRPMTMSYTINADTTKEITNSLKVEMQQLVDYYKQFDKVLINFSDRYRDELSLIEKLKNSLYSKFPKEETDLKFWNYIREILDLEQEELFEKPISAPPEVEPPKVQATINNIASSNEIVDFESKSDENSDEKKSAEKIQSLLSITSLQQQLSLPSGLNMNPSVLGSGLVIPSITNNSNFSTTSTTSSSPRDSPITISSNAASPGKFEMPIRASPSPAKSDTSSTKTRNSPAPSPSKFNENPRNNSPSVVPPSNLYDLNAVNSGMTPDAMNEFLSASLASLAGKLPPGMQPNDLALLFQQKLAEYGVTGFNPSAAAAVISTSAKSTPPPPILPQATSTPTSSSSASSATKHNSYKDLYKDLDKYDLNYLLQSQYGITGLPMAKSSSKTSSSLSKSQSDRHHSSSKRNYDSGLASTSVSSSQSHSNSNLMGMGVNSKMSMMMDLEDPKSELSKLSDFMKSPEYASLLLQHATGYGNPASYGLGSEISISKKPASKKSSVNLPSNYHADLSSLLQTPSKLSETSSSMSNKKSMDYNSILEQHKLPDLTSITPITTSSESGLHGVPDLSALFAPVLSGKKLEAGAPYSHDVLNSFLRNVGRPSADIMALLSSPSSSTQSSKQGDHNSLLFPPSCNPPADIMAYLSSPSSASQSKKSSDLNSLLFPSSSKQSADMIAYLSSPSPTPSSTSSKSGTDQTGSMLPNISPLKVQEISSLFQHTKYPGIPDPLAKSTLAANNMYMTPTASLLKLQQEAINAMMMKPPKATTPLSSLSSSSGGSGNVARNSETPPSSERQSSKSSNRDSPHIIPPTNLKYNFSAADLAVSSIPTLSSPSSLPTDFSRKTPVTPPVDMSSSSDSSQIPKKRNEFASIADLVGSVGGNSSGGAPPPPKIQKLNDEVDNSGVLNLSNND